MRVVFIGKHNHFTLAPLAAVAERHELVGLVESAKRVRRATAGTQARSAAGPVTLLARILGRARRRPAEKSLETLAEKFAVPYLFLDRGNVPDLAVYLRRLCPDVVCVPSLSQLLPAEVLNIPRFGFLNLHPSLLPKYHGPFPWFWQYYHYEQFFGVTVHRIDEGQDTGPILKQAPFFVERGTEVGEAERRGADVAANLLCEALNELESGTARLRPQPRHDFPKARIVRRDEPLVQWDEWDLQRVWHFLRGTQPWLDAVAYPPGGPWRIGPYELGACGEQSGTVGRDDQGNFIAHRQGKIRLWRRQAG